MWRRASLSLLRSSLRHRTGAFPHGGASDAPRALFSSSAFHRTFPFFFSDAGSAPATKRVEDVMPIATGLEREEIEAEHQGKQRFETESPVGPFGTKESPPVIVWLGGVRDDEIDIILLLEEDKPHECPPNGEGGDPDGHDDDDDDDDEHH